LTLNFDVERLDVMLPSLHHIIFSADCQLTVRFMKET